jgi:hypothetical protein
MSHVFSATGVEGSTIISNIDTTGARIVE